VEINKKNKPLVGIIMGSDSDLKVMIQASEFLEKNHVAYEMEIVSAHRTPDLMFEYAKTAKRRGLKVIIAGAGGSAHLPGMIASLTTLPVIGVPIESHNLNGVDSLLSIVQMPSGIPVACVAINGSINAAILACQILALG
jgi:5-(carboxyamino)imidazole ribonucleotide mutase